MKINKLSEFDKEIRLLRAIHVINHVYNVNTEYALDFDLVTENSLDIDVVDNNTFYIKSTGYFDIRLNLNFDVALNNQRVIVFAVSSNDNVNYNVVPFSLREFNFDKKSGNLVAYNNLYPIDGGTYLKFYIKSLLNNISLSTLTETTSFGNVQLPNILLNFRSLSI